MYTVLSLFNYGFYPTIIGLINMVIVYCFFKRNLKYNSLIVVTYFLLCIVGVYYIAPPLYEDIIADGFLPAPSSAEFIVNLLTWLALGFMLLKTDLRLHAIIFICLSVYSILAYYTLIFYSLLYDAWIIYYMVVSALFLRKMSKKMSTTFLFFYLILLLIMGIGSVYLNWEFTKKDYRPSFVTYYYHHNETSYFSFNNIEDSESRFYQVYDLLCNHKNGDLLYIFTEDTLSAFSLKRTTIETSYDGDLIQWSDKVGTLTIRQCDSLLIGGIEYKPSNIDFFIKTTDNDTVVINGSFTELSFGVLSSLQNFLKQEFSFLSNKTIILKNRMDVFKIALRYFSDDKYQICLKNIP